MQFNGSVTAIRTVGRATEQALLAAAVRDAGAGEPGCVILHGEPGVGKTRLVADATEHCSSTHTVLWVRFPRFSSDTTALLPVAQALSRWARSAPDDVRAAAFDGLGDLSAVLPELGPSVPVDGGRLTALITTFVHRLGEDRPVVLVADDLQWADTSSLDLLAYLIAGFGPAQPLAVLGTYRDTEPVPGHRFPEWVADMRRMPRVRIHALGRLDRAGTTDLVRNLRGESTRATGADPDAIYDRSLGNPYLTQLLLQDPGSEAGSIEEVLLATWLRLDAAARTVTQILAIGGRPVPLDLVLSLARGAGVRRTATGAAVESAAAAGLVEVRSGNAWFRHPLVAEVVARTVTPPNAVAWHEAFIRLLADAQLPDHARAALLALHHEAAGQVDDAFTWSIRAADAAAAVRATAEESEHLQRAVRLWDGAGEAARAAVGDRVELLERASLTADRGGHLDVALALATQAAEAVDRVAEPLRSVRLLTTLSLTSRTKLSYGRIAELGREPVALAEPFGPSPELALALAQLGLREMWAGMEGGESRVLAAIDMADSLGATVVLAQTRVILTQFHWSEPDSADSALDAFEVLRREGSLHDWWVACMPVLNCLEGLGRYEAMISFSERAVQDLQAAGAPSLGGSLGAVAAHFLTRLGRWEEARDLLRFVMAHRQPGKWAAESRGIACRLACHSGDLDAADEHFARAVELYPDLHPLGSHLGTARLEFLWATGRLDRAVEHAIDDIARVAAVDEDEADELLLWGLRCTADLADTRPVGREAAAAGVSRLDAARALGPPSPGRREPDDDVYPALAALLAAERARCLRAGDTVEEWRAARDAADRAHFVWEAAWSGYQLGRALLTGRGGRPEATAALRRAFDAATSLGARPLADRIRLVADQAHVDLTVPVELPPSAAGDLDGLTTREREVLALVVAGRTYAEMAKALYISEKTVSVHVSNLLRKTGAANRIELAERARSNVTAT